MHDVLYLNRARTRSKPPVGFQLFICFVNYHELHCIYSRCRYVSILNCRVYNRGNSVQFFLKINTSAKAFEISYSFSVSTLISVIALNITKISYLTCQRQTECESSTI